MTVRLYFEPDKISRTITRERWKEIWRWKRVVQKKLNVQLEKDLDWLRSPESQLFPHIREAKLDHIINPPLLLGPTK